jgi:hypothetical protein
MVLANIPSQSEELCGPERAEDADRENAAIHGILNRIERKETYEQGDNVCVVGIVWPLSLASF